MKINVEGVLWSIQATAKKFKEHEQKGKVISASSIVGHEGFGTLGGVFGYKICISSPYTSVSKELTSDGIMVNAYCHGVVGTDMWVEIDK